MTSLLTNQFKRLYFGTGKDKKILILFYLRSLIAIPLGGQILQATNREYWGLMIFTGFAYVVGLVLFTTVRIMRFGFVWTKI